MLGMAIPHRERERVQKTPQRSTADKQAADQQLICSLQFAATFQLKQSSNVGTAFNTLSYSC